MLAETWVLGVHLGITRRCSQLHKLVCGGVLEQNHSAEKLSVDDHKFRCVAAITTMAQVLCRPLRLGETRSLLVKKCKTALEGKGLYSFVPAPLKARAEKF